jgi:hypothetical protein
LTRVDTADLEGIGVDGEADQRCTTQDTEKTTPTIDCARKGQGIYSGV